MFRVSIITVCFNSAATIRDTIESVLKQAYTEIEYIIVDGGSTDNTMKIIKEYGEKITKVISEPDQGIYDAMNKGIRASTGRAICTLNSDDMYSDSTAVERLVKTMESANSDTVFADLVYVNPLNTDRITRYYDSSRFQPKRLAYGWMPAHPTFMVKRDLYDKWGGYSLNYRIAADYEMVVRLLHKAAASYAYLPEVVVKMRTGGISTRGLSSSWILNNEIVRACQENGLDTNLPRVLMKIPEKLLERFVIPKTKVRS